MESTAARLRNRLATIVGELSELIETLPVKGLERSRDIIIVAPEYYWGELTPAQRATQLELKRNYEPLSELFSLLLRGAPNSLVTELKEADENFRVWLELEYQTNWSVTPNAEVNVRAFQSSAERLSEILDFLSATGDSMTILIPDTNSLLAVADPSGYRSVAGRDSFVFMLLPTVLGELDRLKVGCGPYRGR